MFEVYSPELIRNTDLTSLADNLVSFKLIDTPTIEVPTYDDSLTSRTMIALGNLKLKVENVKTKLKDSPIFLGFSFSSTNETPYSTPKSTSEKKTNTKKSTELSSSTLTSDSTRIPKTREEFKSLLYTAYKKAGCSDTYTRNLIGLDALETGWGQKTVGNYNYGNIKATASWTGATKRAHDKREGSNDAYRSYNSIDEYVFDKLKLLKTAYGMTGNETPAEFARKLKTHGYASAANYEAQVINVIKSV